MFVVFRSLDMHSVVLCAVLDAGCSPLVYLGYLIVMFYSVTPKQFVLID